MILFRSIFILLCGCFQWKAAAQSVYGDTASTVSIASLTSHLRFLTSDSLKGRGNYTPELYTAATYVASQFHTMGLKVLSPLGSFLQPFTTKAIKDSIQWTTDYKSVLNNVIGVLPGSTKPQEIIIISAHYDHVGSEGSSTKDIFYGANDNASGVAAMLSLAEYYTTHKNNSRTLIFCAFAGEELGLLGSTVLAKRFDPEAIISMINLEMLGRSGSKKNTFFITGSYHTNLQQIIRKNLKGEKIKVRSESSLEKNLFERSDNYPFAKKGVPAHSIMSSDDDDACYHQPCDTFERLDINNMAGLIEGIIKGIATIIDGTDTPSRFKR